MLRSWSRIDGHREETMLQLISAHVCFTYKIRVDTCRILALRSPVTHVYRTQVLRPLLPASLIGLKSFQSTIPCLLTSIHLSSHFPDPGLHSRSIIQYILYNMLWRPEGLSARIRFRFEKESVDSPAESPTTLAYEYKFGRPRYPEPDLTNPHF
jgi:hypothetical protein